MKYKVELAEFRAIEVEAETQEEASDIVAMMDDEEILEKCKGDHYYMMQCTNEDCDAATCFGEKNKEKFIETWNTRKLIEKIVEQLKKSSLLVATSKEFWNNPQNGEFVEEVIPLDTAIEIVKEGGTDDR